MYSRFNERENHRNLAVINHWLTEHLLSDWKEFAITITVIEYYVQLFHTHTHTKIPLKFSEILTSNQMISWQVKIESQGDQPRWCRQSSRYSEKCPTHRELLGAAYCRPEELKGPSLVSLFIGSQDDWLQASVFFHPGHDPHDVILIFRQ